MKRSNVENPNLKTVGGRISKARMDKGLSIQQLADAIGKNYTFIRQYEMGIRNPKKEMIDIIAAALNVDSTWLEKGDFTFTDNQHGLSVYCFFPRSEVEQIEKDRNINLQPEGMPYYRSDAAYGRLVDSVKLLRESQDEDLIELLSSIGTKLVEIRKRNWEEVWAEEVKENGCPESHGSDF